MLYRRASLKRKLGGTKVIDWKVPKTKKVRKARVKKVIVEEKKLSSKK